MDAKHYEFYIVSAGFFFFLLKSVILCLFKKLKILEDNFGAFRKRYLEQKHKNLPTTMFSFHGSPLNNSCNSMIALSLVGGNLNDSQPCESSSNCSDYNSLVSFFPKSVIYQLLWMSVLHMH